MPSPSSSSRWRALLGAQPPRQAGSPGLEAREDDGAGGRSLRGHGPQGGRIEVAHAAPGLRQVAAGERCRQQRRGRRPAGRLQRQGGRQRTQGEVVGRDADELVAQIGGTGDEQAGGQRALAAAAGAGQEHAAPVPDDRSGMQEDEELPVRVRRLDQRLVEMACQLATRGGVERTHALAEQGQGRAGARCSRCRAWLTRSAWPGRLDPAVPQLVEQPQIRRAAGTAHADEMAGDLQKLVVRRLPRRRPGRRSWGRPWRPACWPGARPQGGGRPRPGPPPAGARTGPRSRPPWRPGAGRPRCPRARPLPAGLSSTSREPGLVEHEHAVADPGAHAPLCRRELGAPPQMKPRRSMHRRTRGLARSGRKAWTLVRPGRPLPSRML